MTHTLHPFGTPGTWPLRLKKGAAAGLLGLCCAFGPLPLALAQPDTPASTHGFNIPPQALAGALIAFGQQSGKQVSVDPQLLKGVSSPGVNGDMSNDAALAYLLQGTGIGWGYQDGALVFHRLPSADAGGPTMLDSTVVLGFTEENSFQGATVIDQKAIQAFPGANGDITTLLQMHPSVQFSGAQQNSNAPGEIDPADISINGAKFYQNNFMIDGISINNDLDPGAHGYGETRQFDASPSRSHGIALDADLLQEVKVYDSNVPAEYGGFNGGVVDAITRRPSQDLHGKLSYSMSRSAWTSYHTTEKDQANFDNASNEQYQPEFEKTTVRGMLEGHLTDDFGAIVSFSQKRSVIPLNKYADGYNSPNGDNREDQTRQLDNYMFKAYWNVNERLSLDGSFIKAPQENTYFRENYKNSGFTNINGGWQGAFKAVWEGDSARWSHTLALTDLNSSRESESNDAIAWYYSSTKNWGLPTTATSRSGEGAYGNLTQTQRGINYKLKADWQGFRWAGAEHAVVTGMELTRNQATWERETEATSVNITRRDNIATCLNDDPLCSIGLLRNGNTRQWANARNVYGAGKLDLTENKYAFFIHDNLQIGKLGLRPGLRLEGDDYMQKQNLAPRFSGDYDFFGDRSTVLVFGANRYYGRNLFKYRLAEGRQGFNTRYTRTTQGGAWTATQVENLNKFSDLKVPYDDEWTLGLDQVWLDTDFRLKYVHRDGKDKIGRASSRVLGLGPAAGFDSIYYTYTNDASSESDNVTLSITPRHEFQWLGSRTSVQAAFDWSRTKDAYGTYESGITADQYANEDVLYDGKRMAYSELPASDFNRPWTARLTTITEIPQWNLTLSNFLRYRGAYEQIIDSSEIVTVNGEDLAVYEAAKVKAAPTWDMRVSWEIPTGKEQALFAAVDITNVTDHVNEIVGSGSSTVTYEVGRQYWLEVGYRF
ncbi:TonB-dependent receptor [Pseudomonas sp. MAFF 301449]|uniref:TonB-dependent receptor n=1 Tax=Pseudomonas cyclaminis TaxID=2781239 RepID=A0ABR9STR8_9PSED|nr:TonB-dependent receptor [Pseudomonas cyclaminis]MBE8591999.1 TonB-dependent receptor [Pseudomonas cyclaminis]MBE8599161.1 TonB-dependent receptor [Pseudomonas cyclaminis]